MEIGHSRGGGDMTYLQQLKNVVADVKVHQRWVQDLEVCVIDMFKYQTGGLRLRVSHNVQ